MFVGDPRPDVKNPAGVTDTAGHNKKETSMRSHPSYRRNSQCIDTLSRLS